MTRRVLPLFLCLILMLFSACGSKTQTADDAGIPSPTVEPRPDPTEHPAGSVVFSIINMLPAESDIYYISLKPASSEDLSVDKTNDILGGEILKNGAKREVAFVPTEESAYWNLSAFTENGNTYTWRNIELGTFSYITLMIGDEGPEYTIN